MSIYLVTEDPAYYPGPGATDWVSLHESEAEAREAFSKLPANSYTGASLIEITPPTWRVLEEK